MLPNPPGTPGYTFNTLPTTINNTAAIKAATLAWTTDQGMCVWSGTVWNPRGRAVLTVADSTSIQPTTAFNQVNQSNSQTGGTLTISNPTGSPTDGQNLLLRITTTNQQTYSWGTLYHGGSTALPATTTGTGARDYLGFIYDAATSQWDYIGSATGF